MAVEIQFTIAAFQSLIAEATQRQLYRICGPSNGAVYVDHIDVGATPVAIDPGEAAGTLALRVPIEVYACLRDELLAAPNAAPASVANPLGTVVVVLELSVSGTAVTIKPKRREPTPLDAVPGAGPALDQIVSGLSPLSVDLASLFQDMGLATPQTATAEVGAGVVALRFDSTGPLAAHLSPGVDWGLFLDGAAVVAMLTGPMTSNLGGAPVQLTPRWAPQGAVPAVVVDYRAAVPLPDPFTGHAWGSMTMTLSLPAAANPPLVVDAAWTLHLDLAGVPDILETQLEEAALPVVTSRLTTAGGLRATGPASGERDIDLPPRDFAGARLRYDSLVATPQGMTLGGRMQILPAARDTLSISVAPLGVPLFLIWCSDVARRGGDRPPGKVSAKAVTVFGWVDFSSAGAFCGVEPVSMPIWLAPLLTDPGAGSQADPASVSLSLSAETASEISDDVTFMLRTARGVRFINLGRPTVVIDAEGNVANARTNFIDDCLYLTPEQQFKATWGFGETRETDANRFRPPPLEDPSWDQILARGAGIAVQLVSLRGLEPGELIRFRSALHAIEVVANAEGRARLPVILALGPRVSEAMLERINRKSLRGRIGVRTVRFHPRLALAAPSAPFVLGQADGRPALGRRDGDGWRADALDLGARQPLRELGPEAAARLVELNPQPLPPAEEPLVRGLGLSDVIGLIPIPGFASAGLAVARMADGQAALVDGPNGDDARVVGRFEGPIGALAIEGSVAAAVVGDRLLVLEATGDQ